MKRPPHILQGITVANLLQGLKALAFVDTVLFGRPDPRCNFQLKQLDNSKTLMAVFDNRCGDQFSVVFVHDAVLLYGLAHEYPVWQIVKNGDLSASQFYEHVPSRLLDAAKHAILPLKIVSFCFWRTIEKVWVQERPWQNWPELLAETDPDGSRKFLAPLRMSRTSLETYLDWQYYPDNWRSRQLPEEILTLTGVRAESIRAMNESADTKSCLRELDRLLKLNP